MGAAVDHVRQLQRTEADLLASREILACLAEANACPPEWVDEFDRLRAAHYTAETSTYRQITEKLRATDVVAYQKLKASGYKPRLIPGLPPRLVGKVAAKRAKGVVPGAPDYADLLQQLMQMPPRVELPIDADLVALELDREKSEGYGAIWPYLVVAGISALVTYLVVDDDPNTSQLEIQTDQYHEFLSSVGPILRQVGSGMASGNITPQQASMMLASLQAICPRVALSPVPGASICGFKSCTRFFVGFAFASAAAVIVIAGLRGAFRVEGGTAPTRILPPPEGKVLIPRAEPKQMPPRRKWRK